MTVTPDNTRDNSWQFYALCRQHDADLWFPPDSEGWRIAAAKSICRQCPVRIDCAAAGVDEPYGIWAAMTPRERDAQKRHRRDRLRLVRR